MKERLCQVSASDICILKKSHVRNEKMVRSPCSARRKYRMLRSQKRGGRASGALVNPRYRWQPARGRGWWRHAAPRDRVRRLSSRSPSPPLRLVAMGLAITCFCRLAHCSLDPLLNHTPIVVCRLLQSLKLDHKRQHTVNIQSRTKHILSTHQKNLVARIKISATRKRWVPPEQFLKSFLKMKSENGRGIGESLGKRLEASLQHRPDFQFSKSADHPHPDKTDWLRIFRNSRTKGRDSSVTRTSSFGEKIKFDVSDRAKKS